MPLPLRCLVIDDSEDDAELLRRYLARNGFDPTCLRADTMASVSAAIENHAWDVVLCDYHMPELDALGILRLFDERDIDVPFILVSGSMSEEQLVGMMKAGADDIVLKDNLTRLGPVIEREMGGNDAREKARRENDEAIAHMAHHDPLTGLPNRALFQDRLEQAILNSKRSGRIGAVLYLDLDHFKDVNDTLGHPVGDHLLQEVSKILLDCARETDTVARLGGDEFAVVAAHLDNIDGAIKLADRILESLNRPIRTTDHDVNASVSIGITLFPADGSDATSLLKNADLAMYSAKAVGRATQKFYSPGMSVEVEQRKAIETDMLRDLREQAFFLDYQPLIDLRTGRLVGVEALVRWQRPDHGLIPPDIFIPTAERTGLIVPLGAQVLEQACQAFTAWYDRGLILKRIAVNVSAAQLRTADFLPFVRKTLDENGMTGPCLEIEITESMMLHHVDQVGPTLRALHDMGIKVAIDDFGTGYSSLTYLKGFPVDRLKIDRSFVDGITTDSDDRAIASSVIGLAKSLDLKVIAEGVETTEQLDWLRSHQCDEAQGYFIGRPMSFEKIAVWAEEHSAGGPGASVPGRDGPTATGTPF